MLVSVNLFNNFWGFGENILFLTNVAVRIVGLHIQMVLSLNLTKRHMWRMVLCDVRVKI